MYLYSDAVYAYPLRVSEALIYHVLRPRTLKIYILYAPYTL
jgi:hypothetical protein